MMLVPLYSPE